MKQPPEVLARFEKTSPINTKMVQLRPGGKAKKIADKVMKSKNVKLPPARMIKKGEPQGSFLQH